MPTKETLEIKTFTWAKIQPVPQQDRALKKQFHDECELLDFEFFLYT